MSEDNVNENELKRKDLSWLLDQPLDVKLSIIEHSLHVSLLLVNEILQDEARQYCGERYTHDKPYNGRYSRWGYNPSNIKINGQRIRVEVPRIIDKESECNKVSENFKKLKDFQELDESLARTILLGISTRDYQLVANTLLESFGLSRSNVSQEFIKVSEEKLAKFMNRDLSNHEFIALYIDGKYMAKEQMVIALGVTRQGDKIPLGFIQTHSENSESIKGLLLNLQERGFPSTVDILFIIDGSKGIEKAIKAVYGSEVLIQRCQWHKRENVLSYLNEEDKDVFKSRINRAYHAENYEKAKQSLEAIHTDLQTINISAANSLLEGMEETLTLHRLGMHELFGRSFSTTNCIENLNSQVARIIGKVTYWNNSSQRYRWLGWALLEIEPRMRKISNYKKIPLFQEAIKKEIEKMRKKE